MSVPLIFATGNQHKIREVTEILQGLDVAIRTMAEIGLGHVTLPETSDTIAGNAFEKSTALFHLCRSNCFAEDTGLEVEALSGAPGVHTARYAGDDCAPEDNINKLLLELGGRSDRNAAFRTIVSLWWEEQEHQFEGIVRGSIAYTPAGNGGFGYDPIFIPDGFDHTFAELPASVKHTLSHRGEAIRKMAEFLGPRLMHYR